MNAKLIGFFSGFPTRHFTDSIAEVLKEELTIRDSLVFISTWPDNYAQNDEDSHGMHNMFAERNMAFTKHSVIDNRTEAEEAVRLIQEASCIFLMGGNATLQFDLMCRKGILDDFLCIHRSKVIPNDDAVHFQQHHIVNKAPVIVDYMSPGPDPSALHRWRAAVGKIGQRPFEDITPIVIGTGIPGGMVIVIL